MALTPITTLPGGTEPITKTVDAEPKTDKPKGEGKTDGGGTTTTTGISHG